MQKVFRQNLLRRNQNLNRARRKDLQQFKKEKREYDRGVVLQNRADRQTIKAERKNRREDWLLGPLAANRNVGEVRGIYGTVSETKVQAPAWPERLRQKEIPIVAGDRVVVIKGRHKGRISQVVEVREESMTVVLKGLNEADVPIPPWNPAGKTRPQKFAASQLPYNIADVRLVVRVMYNETGESKEVVVSEIRTGEPQLEHEYGSPLPTYTRYAVGNNMLIPWPDADPDTFDAEACDTRAIDVNTITWTPTVYWEDEPLSRCIDELRSPHVRGRGIFKDDFVKEKLMADMESEWKARKRLIGPEAEWHASRKVRGPSPMTLTPQLGELIAATQAQTLAASSPNDTTGVHGAEEDSLKPQDSAMIA